ncbi:hypothetical protein L3Y34_010309 [Caenorhabditis briggsae]|uniref:Uncharacterized protein n=1 Tax=Caenorhabditis briggsae TaxID=6238 RepID=A0AAE8ZPN6_CAEBR|nr:hypothetical protein L3Y34_010309 [Caenorhabditis briggsae]
MIFEVPTGRFPASTDLKKSKTSTSPWEKNVRNQIATMNKALGTMIKESSALLDCSMLKINFHASSMTERAPRFPSHLAEATSRILSGSSMKMKL